MPVDRRRARSYDLARTRGALLAQTTALRTGIAALDADRLARPTRSAGRTVSDLVAHLSLRLGSLAHELTLPEPPRAELTLAEWPPYSNSPYSNSSYSSFSYSGSLPGVVAGEAVAAAGEDVIGAFGRAVERFEEALAQVPAGDRPVATRPAPMRLVDLLVTRCVEAVVHTDDLNDATGLEIPYDRQALAAATRMLADALAAKAPGGAVEVRIPPFAVVQCGEGPRHTRGTPPNVVETDPLTWVRLATGRTDWATALGAARVSASGERADLSQLLPVLG
ncbi:sterol carrier family protein [Streptomyces sp. NPDC000594]|uniref:sterol carrier family protein n=1 Tax=Streptomyces sp. NPDC000594 TaxID=3154261 RepID=UPI003324B12A